MLHRNHRSSLWRSFELWFFKSFYSLRVGLFVGAPFPSTKTSNFFLRRFKTADKKLKIRNNRKNENFLIIFKLLSTLAFMHALSNVAKFMISSRKFLAHYRGLAKAKNIFLLTFRSGNMKRVITKQGNNLPWISYFPETHESRHKKRSWAMFTDNSRFAFPRKNKSWAEAWKDVEARLQLIRTRALNLCVLGFLC